MTANNFVEGPVSGLAARILDVVVGEALGMLPLITVESALRAILSVAVGEALGILTLVTVGPEGDSNTQRKAMS